MTLKELIVSLCSQMSISGCERYSKDKLYSLIGDCFDEKYTDNVGNHIFVKKCGRQNAPKILIDCHYDEIGMLVSSIKEGGFVSVERVGGIDPRLLQSGEVTIYGKEEIYGVFAATAPHLLNAETANQMIPLDKLIIDTGYPKEDLMELIRVGTPVGFRPYTQSLRTVALRASHLTIRRAARARLWVSTRLIKTSFARIYILLFPPARR